MPGGRLFALALVLALALESPVRADSDPWLAPDKGLHVGLSAAIAAGGYGLGALELQQRRDALLLGGGLALLAGGFKELIDLKGAGDPSWKDLTMDLVGAVAGLVLAWGLDLLIRGVAPEGPALLAAPTEQGGVALRF